MSYKGDVFIAVGVIVILAALYLGYSLYTSVQSNNTLQTQTQAGAGSINSSFSSLSNNISNTIRVNAYYLIEIVVLFLFASIGYKIALIGMTINRDETQIVVKSAKQQ